MPDKLYKTKRLVNSDMIRLAFLLVIVLGIYYPVFYAQYLYTDEATQIWFADKGVNGTSIPQGRYLTYIIFKSLFGFINSIDHIRYARIISLTGWILCLPVWYYTLKKIIADNKLPASLLVLSLIYMVCMPPFTVYISWAACLEMFIACTSGLVSGYFCYRAVTAEKITRGHFAYLICCSVVAGIVSLFTYQNGFGCFFIPLFIRLIAGKKFTKELVAGIACSLFIYGLYYVLFKFSLNLTGMQPAERSSLSANPAGKIFFLFTRPLAASFHFTTLFSDKSLPGVIIYILVIFSWFVLTVFRLRMKPLREKIPWFTAIVIFFVLVYLPSLIVTENYPSNRTLFALNFIVFILVAESLLYITQAKNLRKWFTVIAGFLLICNAWYNYRYEFIYPATAEYALLRQALLKNYSPSADTVYVIRPSDKSFVEHYGIIASWDEFGVPSTAKKWTLEPLIRQIIFEKTGQRQLADKLIIISWENYESFLRSGAIISKNQVLINIESMFN